MYHGMDKNKSIHEKIISEYTYKENNKLIMLKMPKQPRMVELLPKVL